MENLKPCPFCGKDAIIRELKLVIGDSTWVTGCQTDYCWGQFNKMGYPRYYSKEDAVKAWNKRNEL